MQDNKTNKKTIIFQSVENKAFCDALIQAKSKKTGISIMRLIEDALINEFGFKNSKLNEWCCSYCNENATTSYMSLLRLLPDNNDIFVLYKIICRYADIALTNDSVMNNQIVLNVSGSSVPNSDISDDKAIERIFMICERKDIEKVFYDFVYVNSNRLDEHPAPIEDIVQLLLNIDGRDKLNE